LDALPSHIAILDEAGTIVTVNAAWRRFADENSLAKKGWGIGEKYAEVCEWAVGGDASLAAQAAAGIGEVLAGQRNSFELEYPCHITGEQRWFALRVSRFPQPGPAYAVVAQEDITARKVTELALEQRTSYLFALIENSPLAIVVLDAQQRIWACNPAFERLFQYSSSEIVGASLDPLVAPPDMISEAQELTRRSSSGELLRVATRRRRKDGTLVDVEIYAVPLLVGGKQVGAYGFYKDISEQRRAEEALRESEEKFAKAFHSSPDSIIISMPDEGLYLDVNDQFLRTTGYRREEVIGRTSLELGLWDDPHQRAAFYEALRREGMVRDMEVRWRTKSGTLGFGRIAADLIDLRGRRCVLSVVRDITERRRAEEALAASEEHYRLLFEKNPLPMWVFDLETLRFLTVNEAAVRHYGYSRDAFLQMTMKDIRAEEDVPVLLADLQEPAAHLRFAGVRRHRKKDGTIIHVEITADKIVFNNRPARLVLANDVTERLRVERQIRESQERFQLVARATNDAVWDWDLVTNAVWWSEGVQSLFGYSAGQVGTDADWRVAQIHPDDRDRVDTSIHKVIESAGQFWSEEYRYRRADGSYADVYDRGYVLHDADGKPVRMIGAMQDITYRKRAEESLRQINQTLKALVETSPLPIVVLSLAGVVQLWNRAAEKVFGWTAEETLGRPFPIVPPDKVEEFTKLHRKALEGEPQAGVPVVRQKKDGTLLDVRLWTAPLRGVGGNTIGVMGVFEDVTERRRAEEALRESEVRYRLMVEGSEQVFFYVHDPEHRFEYLSPSVKDVLGYDPEELLGQPYDVLLTGLPDDAIVQEMTDGALRDGQRRPAYTVAHRHKDGRVVALEIVETPIKREGRVVGIQGFARDVTERKRAEQLRRAVYRIAEATDQAASLDDLYPAIHQIIGEVMPAANFFIAQYDEQKDLLSFPYFVDEADSPPAPCKPGKELTSYVLRTGRSLLCTAEVDQELRARGEVEVVGAPSAIWLGVPLRVGEKTIGVMVVQDYSDPTAYGGQEQQILEYVSSEVAKAIERKHAEDALRDSEQRYRTLFERNLAGVYRSALDGRLLDCNEACAQIFGYTREEILAHPTGEFYFEPSEREAFLQQLLERGSLTNCELRMRRKDGSVVWILENASVLRGPDGAPAFIEGTLIDITDRREMEEQLLQAQKLEAVGLLAGGVAHDFNNLLMVVKGHTELMLDRLSVGDAARYNAEQVLKAAERAASLTAQLLAFSRKQVIEPKILNLNTVVHDTEKMLRRLIREDVELIVRPGAGLGRVKADPGQLTQVILNLAVNARDAMPNGGKLVIETANVELDDGYVRLHPSVIPGAYVLLAVSDSGRGMDRETLARVFEPFFTTKERGKGTGLGLATVYGIVKQSGGWIWVYSEPNRGTTFKIYLPRVDEEQDVSRASSSAKIESTNGYETVLLVEDEHSVRELAHQFLMGHGYKVLEASNGVEALEMAKGYQEQIHLLVTDVVMPQMSGPELAERLRELRPAMRVLYVSGYTDNYVVSQEILAPGRAFLSKPYRRAEFLNKVRELLDAPSE
jgi:PAS domain S-box-containing protein